MPAKHNRQMIKVADGFLNILVSYMGIPIQGKPYLVTINQVPGV
jgi:hypothetical protein